MRATVRNISLAGLFILAECINPVQLWYTWHSRTVRCWSWRNLFKDADQVYHDFIRMKYFTTMSRQCTTPHIQSLHSSDAPTLLPSPSHISSLRLPSALASTYSFPMRDEFPNFQPDFLYASSFEYPPWRVHVTSSSSRKASRQKAMEKMHYYCCGGWLIDAVIVVFRLCSPDRPC